MKRPTIPSIIWKLSKALLLLVSAVILGVWLYFTPHGLLGKADALGYAVCHRISSHSYFFMERPLPLCARCTGMHLGALLGLIYQVRYKKRSGMPSLKIAIPCILFLVAFGVDGVNSYMHFFPNLPQLYTPMNWLRLLTGTCLGLGIAAVLYPIFNQTMWVDWDPKPALTSWGQLAVLLAGVALIDLSIISANPLLVYPLAILSAFDIVVILTMIYAIVWVMLARRENRFNTLRDLFWPLLAGFTCTILQIVLMNYARFLLTGTWGGFNL